MKSEISICIIAMFATAAVIGPLMAQTGDTASIYGTVRDPSGSSVQQAEVVARNLDTGTERQTTTTDTGDYVFANLPVGSYDVIVSKQGFKVFSHQGIALQVDRRGRGDVVVAEGADSVRGGGKWEGPPGEASGTTPSPVDAEPRLSGQPPDTHNRLG